jgi:hypothetical protein
MTMKDFSNRTTHEFRAYTEIRRLIVAGVDKEQILPLLREKPGMEDMTESIFENAVQEVIRDLPKLH